jgi:anti-sigma B factor antagonist
MKIKYQENTLHISELNELGAATSGSFRDEVHAGLPMDLKVIEVDLSQTVFLDSCGLGALVMLYKTAFAKNGGIKMRLLNPRPPVQQIFELTRMHLIFEIVKA